MELTGKCKEDFGKWFCKDVNLPKILEEDREKIIVEVIRKFGLQSDSEKYGIFNDWFDTVGIILDLQPVLDYNNSHYTKVLEFFVQITVLNVDLHEVEETTLTRPEARTKAIEKANEIYNNN